jgi:hypothetical protein
MDVFSRTFLPAAADANIPAHIVGRHLPVLRRCVDSDDPTVLVTRCVNPAAPKAGDYLLLLTYRRLVVTQETLFLRRMRLHLNTNLRHLSDVTWGPDRSQTALELAATAMDGVRERFRVRVDEPDRVWHFDALFKHVFHERRLSLAA